MSENSKIPLVDLKKQYTNIKDEVQEAINNVINETAFIKGKFVDEFEKNFAKYCGAKHCIGVGNGTDALIIALQAYNIGPGDEVIVPANSFIATSEAVTRVGANVVFVDCQPASYNIDPQLIESKITSKTKAIIPVHLFGQPADLDLICEISKKHNLIVVQDCAQAHGAKYKGKELATFGDLLCFSFYPGKNLGAFGDAGAIVTNTDSKAEYIRMLANHGRKVKYDHDFEGMNSRLDGIQAAILNVKLQYLDQWNHNRIKNSQKYNEYLKNIGQVHLPYVNDNVKHVYHLYVIRTEERKDLIDHLIKRNIASGIHYPKALPNLKAYRHLGCSSHEFPVSTKYQDEILSLPMYPELSIEDINRISKAIKSYYL